MTVRSSDVVDHSGYGLDFDDVEVPTIFGGDEGCDDVQLEQAMTTVCRTRRIASCNNERRWLELADTSARRRSWGSLVCTEGSGWW
jgi:hypothetical protein